MTNIDIQYDAITGFFDACILNHGIATQAKSLDECIQNLSESLSLLQKKEVVLTKFNISYEDAYVNS